MKNKVKPAYAILELGTGYMDGWYSELDGLKEIARYFDEVRPSYQHKIISQVDPFPIRDPVVFLAEAIMTDAVKNARQTSEEATK